MPELIRVNVDDPGDLLTGYGVGAKVRLERASLADFSDVVEVSTQNLDATITQYEFWDGGGSDASWYRSRYSAAAGAPYSEYSDPFQPGAPQAYATLDALREYVNPPDNSQDNLLSDLLVDASGYLDAKCGRDFYRHPAVSGTEIRTFNGSGHNRLRVSAGIVSLTTVELASITGGSYSTIASSGWSLDPPELVTGESYTGVVLTDVSPYRTWYPGTATVRLTGVFGSASVPAMIRKATLDLAREWYRQGPGGGGPVGVNQFGTPIFGGGMPLSVKQAIEHYAPALVA